MKDFLLQNSCFFLLIADRTTCYVYVAAILLSLVFGFEFLVIAFLPEIMSRSSRTLYVGNLPGDIREREVEDLFYKVNCLALALTECIC